MAPERWKGRLQVNKFPPYEAPIKNSGTSNGLRTEEANTTPKYRETLPCSKTPKCSEPPGHFPFHCPHNTFLFGPVCTACGGMGHIHGDLNCEKYDLLKSNGSAERATTTPPIPSTLLGVPAPTPHIPSTLLGVMAPTPHIPSTLLGVPAPTPHIPSTLLSGPGDRKGPADGRVYICTRCGVAGHVSRNCRNDTGAALSLKRKLKKEKWLRNLKKKIPIPVEGSIAEVFSRAAVPPELLASNPVVPPEILNSKVVNPPPPGMGRVLLCSRCNTVGHSAADCSNNYGAEVRARRLAKVERFKQKEAVTDPELQLRLALRVDLNNLRDPFYRPAPQHYFELTSPVWKTDIETTLDVVLKS